MKFRYTKLSPFNCRKGVLSEFARLPGLILETPLLLLYTRAGSVPHITKEVFDLITKEPQAVLVTLPTTILCHEALTEFGKGIAHFIGLKDCVSFLTVQDPALKNPLGYNGKQSVSIWSYRGRVSVEPEKFMDMMEAFKPDVYHSLVNGDTNPEHAQKRSSKILESTRVLFEKCRNRHKTSDVLKDSAFFGVVEGGHDLEARKRCAQLLPYDTTDGVFIDGLHDSGSEVEAMSFEQIKPVINETLSHLPEDKLRIVPGCWSPQNVLKLLEAGIDVIDSSIVYVVTERMSAFIFQYKSVPIDSEETPSTFDMPHEISLSNEKYKEDFIPLVNDCTCLACRKHTRAYIHHLVTNKELLALTLLMMHNLHHYIEFFRAIRQAFSEGKKIVII